MRIDNAYRIVEALKNKDNRYDKLISTMESKIEYQKSLSVGTFRKPNINFSARAKVQLSKAEIKAITIYLTNKYFEYLSYTWGGKIFIEYRKMLFSQGYIVKLI